MCYAGTALAGACWSLSEKEIAERLRSVLRHAERPDSTIRFAGDYFAPVSGSVEDAATSGFETARRVACAMESPCTGAQ